MPNWTSNRVIIKGDADTLKTIKELLQTKDQSFDFNKIIPMPESLNLASGGITDTSVKIAQSKKGSAKRAKLMATITLPYDLNWCYAGYGPRVLNTEEDVVALGQIYIDNKKKYGHMTWYNWCCDKWGTKWNACDTKLSSEEDGQLEYFFQTAWSEPTPVFIELSKKFPDVTVINHANYEDPEPWRTYITEFKNGEVTSESDEVDEDMKEEYESYFDDDEDEEETDNA